MMGNLQADGVQSRQTLFVRYCRNKKTGFLLENPVFCLVRFLQLAAFEMQEEGVKRDMVGEDFPEAPLSHLRCQLSTRHALRVPFQGSLNNKDVLIYKPPRYTTKTATPMHFCIWVWRFCNDWKRKAIPHKERLATLHAICLQIPRHISQKCS